MAKTVTKEVVQERQISRDDAEYYVAEGWKKTKNVGSNSCIVTRTVKQEVEVEETELEVIDRQIKELEVRKKALTKTIIKDTK